MIITTTSTIEGFKIEYIDILIINKSVNIVDISELFFGIQNSKSALSGMEKLKKELMRETQRIAKDKAADAVIGFSIDYDQIGGSKGGMLMASATGTLVKLKSKEIVIYKKNPKRIEIFNLVKKYFEESNPKSKILLEIEMKQYNIDSDIKNKIIDLLKEEEKKEKEIREAKEKIEQENRTRQINDLSEKRKKQKQMKEAEKIRELEKYPIRKELMEEGVNYIKCAKCFCRNYVNDLKELTCKQCSNDLSNGEKVS